jgi:hypothetical protein
VEPGEFVASVRAHRRYTDAVPLPMDDPRAAPETGADAATAPPDPAGAAVEAAAVEMTAGVAAIEVPHEGDRWRRLSSRKAAPRMPGHFGFSARVGCLLRMSRPAQDFSAP